MGPASQQASRSGCGAEVSAAPKTKAMASAAPEVAPAPKPKAAARRKSLIKAVKDGDVASVEEHLQQPDCNLEALGMWDNTPLLAACTYGHTEAALCLIDHKANVLARNEHSATALHYACVEGSLSVVTALLKAGEALGSAQVTEMVN